LKLPKTYFGFPVDEGDKHPPPKKGMALLLALTVIVIIMGFASEMVISSNVAIGLATGVRDSIKAEYMAKSGVNLALFLTQIDFGIDLKLTEMNQPLADGSADFWSMLNGMPIGGSTVEMVTQAADKFDLGKVSDSKVIDQLKLFEGSFQIDVSDEESKINLNYLQNSRRSEVAVAMLTALFSCPAERALLESKKLSPKMLAARVLDFIDSDSTPAEDSGFSDENSPYSSYKPPYKARNFPLDSIEDLRLVEGWDDEVHAIFAPYLTVFPFSPIQGVRSTDSRINLNTASKGLMACLFQDVNQECRDKFALEHNKKGQEKQNLSDGKNMEDFLKKSLCYGKRDGSTASEAKEQWFKANSLTFKIVAEGEVNNQKKRIEMVIKRLDSKGMRERQTEKSWDLLYWKMT
jgi:type II secretory pathway component PulK